MIAVKPRAMTPSAIDDIEERLQDLTHALREAGHDRLADGFARHAQDFTEPTRVRRAVNAIATELERLRLDPALVPDSPKAMVAANRLEDVCRQALQSGVIAAAPLSTGAQVRRKVAVALGALLVGALLLLIPLLLVHLGLDFSDLRRERVAAPLRLPRGEETSTQLVLLQAALEPDSVGAVAITPVGKCAQPLPGGATCNESDPRLWPPGKLPTFELKLPHQAYGLLFAFDALRVLGSGIGGGRLWLAATDDTPEGRYQFQLTGTYHGYTPQACGFMQRLQNACPRPRAGPSELHEGIRLATVIVDVVQGDPTHRSGEKRLAEAKAAEERKAGEERAAQIESMLGEIERVLVETEKLLTRKRWEDGRQRVQKLVLLFAPLDALAQGAAAAQPPALRDARARLDELKDRLEELEGRVFEQTFSVVTAESNRNVPEEQLFAKIARSHRIGPAYVEEIYTGRAEEIQRRLQARAQAHMDAIKALEAAREKRCGPLPVSSWKEVNGYVQAHFVQTHVEIALGECMTPRMTENECWQMRCDYERREEVAVERPRVVTKHAATFYIAQQRVIRHSN